MAILVTPEDVEVEVHPQNDKFFTAEEVCRILKCATHKVFFSEDKDAPNAVVTSAWPGDETFERINSNASIEVKRIIYGKALIIDKEQVGGLE